MTHTEPQGRSPGIRAGHEAPLFSNERAMTFPAQELIVDSFAGTKTRQVAAIGNSVCPQVARSIVEANYVREG